MKITGIPLDKRPYNYQFLKDIAKIDKGIELVLPEKEYLGHKKIGGDTEYLNEFLLKNIDTDAFIISLDMLIYGGLFPARIHMIEYEELKEKLEIIKKLKDIKKDIKIYASSLVLRTPKYNSAEEEPEYYGYCGRDIFYYGYYQDKKVRVGLSRREEEEYDKIKDRLDMEAFGDFVARRDKNLRLILDILDLVDEGYIDMLIIPQDDASEFGLTAKDQRRVYAKIEESLLEDKVFLHPGTDESGCTLLTRAYLDKKGSFGIYTIYNNPSFAEMIPNYEDRPFKYSLLSHARACGINLVDNIDESHGVLAINSPGMKMQEAFEVNFGIDSFGNILSEEARGKDISYYRYRDNNLLLEGIDEAIANGKKVGVADLSYSNGGEESFVKLLDKKDILKGISAYAGWNTTCNSLGTVLASLVFSTLGNNRVATEEFKWNRLINDWIYQSHIRFDIQLNELDKYGATYSNFNGRDEEILDLIKLKVEEYYSNKIRNKYRDIRVDKVEAPFGRMSGLEFEVEVK